MNKVQNLLFNIDERNKRKQEKANLILRFLRQQLWSTQAILQLVMHLQSRQAAHKSLKQMADQGLIKAHVYKALGGNITIWGITAHGQAMAFYADGEEIIKAYFEPAKISEQNIRHQLDLQKIRLVAEAHGWSSWQDGDRLGILDKNAKRPDGVALDKAGIKIAIECERSFKTVKRYEQILLNYLKIIRANQVSKVVWVCPTEDFKTRLEILIKSIKTLKVAGQIVQIEPQKHHKNIYFCSYEQWPNFCRESR